MAKRKIVDAHHHLWKLSDGYKYPWLQDKPTGEGMLGSLVPIVRDYLPEDYHADTANYEVTRTVHVEAVPVDGVKETRWLECFATTDNVAHAIVGRAELNAPDLDRVLAAQAQTTRVRGIRQIANWHKNPGLSFTPRDLLADPAWLAGFKLLRKYDFSFDLQLYPGQMAEAAALAHANPETLIAINHAGMPVDRDAEGIATWHTGMKMLAAEDNVVAKISGLGMVDHKWSEASIRPFVLGTIEYFGTDRAMFGSNFPVDKLYTSFDVLYGAFENIVASFSESEKTKLFHDNALRAYRL